MKYLSLVIAITLCTLNITAQSINISFVTKNVSCFAGNDGSINVSITGGTLPYKYTWSTGDTIASLSNLSAGSYFVTVKDANDSTDFDVAVITQPASALSINVSSGDVSCNGLTDGFVDLTVSGGTSPYVYVWSSGVTTEDISNLSGGTYNCSIFDGNTCTGTVIANINDPIGFILSTVTSNITCAGNTDGAINLSISGGGTSPYVYKWSNSQTIEDISGLSAGTYAVTVIDSVFYCSITSVTISEPTAISATVASTNPKCKGDSDGLINITVSGGSTPYSFKWSTGAITEDISGLIAGSYAVTVKDANNCSSVNNVTVTEPDSLLTVSTKNANLTCNGGSDGTATVSSWGGLAPYSISWSTGSTSTKITNLTAGNYTATITDSYGCQKNITSTLTEPAGMTLSITSTNISCFGAFDGAVDLTVSGTSTPYTYSWNTSETTEDIKYLSSGTYTVNVTDSNGCATTTNVTLTQPGQITLTFTTVFPTGANAFDGKATVNASGGTPPYTYLWSTNAAASSIDSLDYGLYTVVVTDSKGCQQGGHADVANGMTDKLLMKHIEVYPNPATDILFIDFKLINIPNVSLEIYDVLGNKVFHNTSLKLPKNKLDLTLLSSGIYFLKLNLNGNSVMKKIVKQ